MSDTQRFVASIPPLSTIKDADTRRVLEALVSGWRTRNGDLKPDADERFITKGELKKLVEDVNSGYFTKGGAGFDSLREAAGGRGDLERYINDLLTATTNDILNNQLWTVLGERIPILEIPNIFTRLGRVETVVRDEMKIRSTADEAIIESVEALGVRVGNNEAGILNEKNLRANSDNALVQAVNTIWAAVGSNSGIVQGGQEVVANTTGAVAQKWNQVQTALRDPLNGQILGVANVRDAAKATSDKITNRLTAERTIKVDVNGHVAGIGVIAEADLTSGATSSAVVVRADKFAIGGVGGSTAVPFRVYTTQTLAPDGVTVIPPGVYLDQAFIGNGTIGSAQIGRASIGTLLVAGEAIVTNRFASAAGGTVAAGGDTYAVALAITMPPGSSGVLLTGMVNVICTSGNATAYVEIWGSNGFSHSVGFSLVNGFYTACPVQCLDSSPIPNSATTYHLLVRNPSAGPGSNQPLEYSFPNISAIGAKR